jgi:hypothetical protein
VDDLPEESTTFYGADDQELLIADLNSSPTGLSNTFEGHKGVKFPHAKSTGDISFINKEDCYGTFDGSTDKTR